MNKKYKKILITLIIFNFYFFISGLTINFQEGDYSGTITYNEKAFPGEAVFARMNIKIQKNSKKKNSEETSAVLQLLRDNKKIDSCGFYFLNSKLKRQTNPDMLAGIPISCELDAEKQYSLKLLLTAGSTPEKEILLPFFLEKKEFEKEILELDNKNSGIKQNMSPERIAQIKKLNTILETIMINNIYSLEPFEIPVKTQRITAGYGDRRIYKYTNGKSSSSIHYGIDYGVPKGTPVHSCGSGKIVLSEFRISTGWSIVIEHLPGLYSLYYHLSSLSVKEGDNIKKGEKIGLSGATGLATGPHLHWEVRLNACAVDPLFFTKNFTFTSLQE